MGTPDFAVPALKALIQDSRFEVAGVITQPDSPVGRHASITPPPVKVVAEENKIPVFQPKKLDRSSVFEIRTSKFELRNSNYDAVVVVAYGKILPQWFLDLPKHGVINVHASLLPRWRGASPIQSAIATGDKKTGVTIMKIDAQLDHGPILAAQETATLKTDTAESLHDRLAELGAKLLPDTLADYLSGKLKPREQDHDAATTCRTLKRENGKIDWTKSAEEIERLVRAYHPWPGTWTEYKGKRLKILQTKISSETADREPGEFFSAPHKLLVACEDKTALELVMIQPEGKKPMTAHEFVSGQKTTLVSHLIRS